MSEKSKKLEMATFCISAVLLCYTLFTGYLNYQLDSRVKSIDAQLKELATTDEGQKFWEDVLSYYERKASITTRIVEGNQRVLISYYDLIKEKFDTSVSGDEKLERVMIAWGNNLKILSEYKETIDSAYIGYFLLINQYTKKSELLKIAGWKEFSASLLAVEKWKIAIDMEVAELLRSSEYIALNDVVAGERLILMDDMKDPIDVAQYCLRIGRKFGDQTFSLVDNPAKQAIERLILLNGAIHSIECGNTEVEMKAIRDKYVIPQLQVSNPAQGANPGKKSVPNPNNTKGKPIGN